MSKTILIANWKMQLQNKEAVEVASGLKNIIKENINNTEVILCPSFTALQGVAEIIKDSPIKLGAQNVFYQEKGSYTGEISSLMLNELGVAYAIVGHSERRQFLKETDEDVNLKLKICLKNNLIPIMCIGETFEERSSGKTEVTLIHQLTIGLEDIKLNEQEKIIIAYEPVWVIGRGQAVEPEEAKRIAQIISKVLLDFFSPEIIKNNISIIYGGSVDADNVNSFISDNLLTGVLVGGASLNIEKFSKIIEVLNSK